MKLIHCAFARPNPGWRAVPFFLESSPSKDTCFQLHEQILQGVGLEAYCQPKYSCYSKMASFFIHYRHEIQASVSECYGSLSGGGVGLGVRILSNRIRWGGYLHLGWHLCCGVVRGAWKWLNYSKFLCTTRRRAFSTQSVYFVITPSSNPPSLYLFILWLFCMICYS